MNLNPAPLIRVVTTRQIRVHYWPEADQAVFYRARRHGYITEENADRLCIRHLNLQPELLWPELTV